MAQKVKTQQLDPATHQTGWDYIQITASANSVSKVVTFPTQMASAPKAIIVTPTGYVISPAPTSLASTTTAYGSGFAIGVSITNVSSTGFQVTLTASGTNAFGVSYTGFSWLAEV